VPSDGSVRAVIDTNVLLSGLMWHGKPHALIEQVRAGTLVLLRYAGASAGSIDDTVMRNAEIAAARVRSWR
jgi:peptidase E